jgi:hypothetical protein
MLGREAHRATSDPDTGRSMAAVPVMMTPAVDMQEVNL